MPPPPAGEPGRSTTTSSPDEDRPRRAHVTGVAATFIAPILIAAPWVSSTLAAQGQPRETPFQRLVAVDTPAIHLPEPTGHHLVGAADYYWVDRKREALLTARDDDVHQVGVRVWYPAAAVSAPRYAPYVLHLSLLRRGLMAKTEDFGPRVARDLAVHARVRTHSLAEPPMARTDAPGFPVVLFSPGGNMSRHWHTALLQDLASRGYVAVAMSHLRSGVDVFPMGGLVDSRDWSDPPPAGAGPEDDLADYLAADVRLVLDRLEGLDAAPAGRGFGGALDLERVAILGHSRGGDAVARLCSTASAVDACVTYDNIGPSREAAAGLDRPQLAVRSTDASDWPEGRVRRLREYLSRNSGLAMEVTVRNANHFTFSDLPIVDPDHYPSELDPRRGHRLIAAVTAAFLDTHLRDPHGARDEPGEPTGGAPIRALADTVPELSLWMPGESRPERSRPAGEPAVPEREPVAPEGEPARRDPRPEGSSSPAFPEARWNRVPPEESGWDAARLARADSIARAVGTEAYTVVQDGRLVHEFGDLSHRYRLHSVRKSLLSALYGIAVEEGSLDLDRTLEEIGVDDATGLGPFERRARVRHLLASRSGVYLPAAHENEGWDEVRPARASHAPGSRFFYSNWDFNVAGTVYQVETEENLFEAFQREIAGPLGMEDFRPEDGAWRYDRDRSAHPAYVFRMSARDLARFGLLHLRNGRWRGRQVVPREWIEASTEWRSAVHHPRTGEILDVGFGWMWWVSDEGKTHVPGVQLGPDAFSARGTGTQLLLILPERDLVFVHREDTDTEADAVGMEAIGRILAAVLDAKPTP